VKLSNCWESAVRVFLSLIGSPWGVEPGAARAAQLLMARLQGAPCAG
jgi:hypothetical protein